MPQRKLTDPERRELTIAALSGASPTDLAKRYGVSRVHVYGLKHEAEQSAEAERDFWCEVCKALGI